MAGSQTCDTPVSAIDAPYSHVTIVRSRIDSPYPEHSHQLHFESNIEHRKKILPMQRYEAVSFDPIFLFVVEGLLALLSCSLRARFPLTVVVA